MTWKYLQGFCYSHNALNLSKQQTHVYRLMITSYFAKNSVVKSLESSYRSLWVKGPGCTVRMCSHSPRSNTVHVLGIYLVVLPPCQKQELSAIVCVYCPVLRGFTLLVHTFQGLDVIRENTKAKSMEGWLDIHVDRWIESHMRSRHIHSGDNKENIIRSKHKYKVLVKNMPYRIIT